MINKHGQVWIETVLYTLIGLSLIGLVLAFVTPKINESKDRLVIEQTIDSLNDFDAKINSALQATGNRRTIEFTMKRGELTFDSPNDRIIFELKDSRVLFSQPNVEINAGRIKILTTQGSNINTVALTLNYAQNLVFNNQEDVKKISAASTPYRFSIEYAQTPEGAKVVNIDTLEG